MAERKHHSSWPCISCYPYPFPVNPCNKFGVDLQTLLYFSFTVVHEGDCLPAVPGTIQASFLGGRRSRKQGKKFIATFCILNHIMDLLWTSKMHFKWIVCDYLWNFNRSVAHCFALSSSQKSSLVVLFTNASWNAFDAFVEVILNSVTEDHFSWKHDLKGPCGTQELCHCL